MLAPFGIRPKGTLAVRMLPLAQALVRRGHTVTIVAPPVQNPQDAGQEDVYEGVPVIHTPLPTWPGAAGVAHQVRMLLQHVLRERPDVLHLFKPKGYSGLATLLARLVSTNLPLVIDTDDWEGWGGWNDVLPYPYAAKKFFAWQERTMPSRADAVTVASRTLETQVWGGGVPPQRVFYLPNGIPGGTAANTGEAMPGANTASVPGQAGGPQQVVLYTRFWEFDVRDVVAAFAPVVQQCPAARLVVVGKGERGEERELLRLAQRAGIAAAIDYRGWVEPAHIPPILANATIALAPMDDTLINRARCSVKLLELMQAGLAVVAGRVGQAAEYLEDMQSGILVDPGNPAALARATILLLNDAPLCARLGANARRRVMRLFNWDVLVADAERAYEKAMSID
jgi:glycosyltransferase involved in cell wall biosynthesis